MELKRRASVMMGLTDKDGQKIPRLPRLPSFFFLFFFAGYNTHVCYLELNFGRSIIYDGQCGMERED